MSGLSARMGFPDRQPLLAPFPLADEPTGVSGACPMAVLSGRASGTGAKAGKGQVVLGVRHPRL